MAGKDKNIAKAKKKKKLPYEWRRINHFFELFNDNGASEELWKMVKLAVTNDEEETEGWERSNMIFLYESTKELYENIYILLQVEKNKTLKK
jgi:hypothetical protein